ncbi:MAG TPA: universal stress protein [Thermoleophilaceae bacterium]|nr:universal stress protein [Thermoleophilaceae bacterium]
MWERLVVGYDGTDEGDDAMTLARVLAAAGGGEVIAACVRPLPHFRRGDGELRRTLEDEAGSTLAAIHGSGIDTRPLVARSPAQGLFELAESDQADLLVVGSSHRGGLGAVLAGGVGRALLQGAPCAVAVAPRGYRDGDVDRLRVIGVGYDGTAESETALEGAIRLGLAAETTMRVVTVVAPSSAGDGGSGRAPREPSARDLMRERLNEAIERCPRELRALGQMLTGSVTASLCDEAERGMDILLVGSRGFGPLMRVAVGSVAAELMRSAPCPVLVFPRGDGGPPGRSGERTA